MGWNDRMADLKVEAEAVAVQASAIKFCRSHDVLIDRDDPEAVKRAYAYGTSRWKKGDMGCEREVFMAAIDDAINLSADECPQCAKISAE